MLELRSSLWHSGFSCVLLMLPLNLRGGVRQCCGGIVACHESVEKTEARDDRSDCGMRYSVTANI